MRLFEFELEFRPYEKHVVSLFFQVTFLLSILSFSNQSTQN